MGITLEVYDGTNWVDKTGKMVSFTHGLASRELEKIDFTLVNDDVAVGQKVRAKRGATIFFEGVVYERRKKHAGRVELKATAYSDLILYDRYVVFRSYATGTTAGEIVRDLAALEAGVDVTNVDDGPSLLANWEIENLPALQVMRSVARGTNYYIRMRPGKVLYFKPKAIGTPIYTITQDRIIEAEYSEDRWRLKNRVIYVGAGGEVLADVSEGSGDLPVVVSDPFLADRNEALRRANIRLALNREYGRQLKIVMSQSTFEASGIDLFSTVAVNLPNIGVNENMFVVEIEYDPKSMQYTLTLGGQLEFFEEFFAERIGGDVAARFGGVSGEPELLSALATISSELGGYTRVSASTKHPTYVNKPPLTLYNALNVMLNENGEAGLVSGATSGSFEARLLPPSGLTFVSFVEAYWDAYTGGGSVSASILDPDGNAILNVANAVATRRISLPRWPRAINHLTYRSASSWAASGATVSDVRLGPVGGWCLKMVPSTLGTYGTITYPATGSLGLALAQFRYLRLYLYGDYTSSFTVKIQLWEDASNYLEGSLAVFPDEWRKYEAVIKTFTRVGSPSTINAVKISAPYILLIDSDHILLSHVHEVLRLKFSLSRPSAANTSPRVGAVRIVWREGGA
jgi:hypothetical protein